MADQPDSIAHPLTKNTALTAVRSGDAVMPTTTQPDPSGLGMFGGQVGQGIPGSTPN